MCETLQIAPSTYYDFKAKQHDPAKQSAREQSAAVYRVDIQRVWNANFQAYGARKVWNQLRREGFTTARCTVERLMRRLGLQGAVRGKVKRTTFSSKENRNPFDLVHRDCHRDETKPIVGCRLHVCGDLDRPRVCRVLIDAFSRMIVGWRAATSMSAELTLDALKQAIGARDIRGTLIHHSDRGSQYLSIRYSKRLSETGIDASVGSVGSAYENALAETINGLCKTEVIRKRGSRKNLEAVEYAALKWFTGSILSDCLNRLEIFLLWNWKNRILLN